MLNLFPKNDVFYDLFDRAATNMERAAELMLELCHHKDRREELVGAIREVEHKGDKLTTELLKLLVKSFITPLDREDIHALGKTIDDVVDNIDDASRSFITLQLGEPLPEYLEQAKILAETTKVLRECVAYIRRPASRTKCHALIKKVYHLESEGDSLHNRAIAKLFSTESDPITVMKWKQLYDYVEEALDSCQGVAHTLEFITLKTV